VGVYGGSLLSVERRHLYLETCRVLVGCFRRRRMQRRHFALGRREIRLVLLDLA
jgi:hypothetical protein